MDNTTRKELLYRARAAGYPGSILDVYANYDQGKDLIGEFQDQQRHQQMSGMAAQQSGLQQSAQQGGQQPQIDMQPQPVAMPTIPSPNFTLPQPPQPIGVQSQDTPVGIVSGQSGPNQGRAIFATGGFKKDPPKEPTYVYSKNDPAYQKYLKQKAYYDEQKALYETRGRDVIRANASADITASLYSLPDDIERDLAKRKAAYNRAAGLSYDALTDELLKDYERKYKSQPWYKFTDNNSLDYAHIVGDINTNEPSVGLYVVRKPTPVILEEESNPKAIDIKPLPMQSVDIKPVLQNLPRPQSTKKHPVIKSTGDAAIDKLNRELYGPSGDYFASGGFKHEEGDPIKDFDLSKSIEENIELNRRAQVMGWNSVADYEKSGWGQNQVALKQRALINNPQVQQMVKTAAELNPELANVQARQDQLYANKTSGAQKAVNQAYNVLSNPIESAGHAMKYGYVPQGNLGNYGLRGDGDAVSMTVNDFVNPFAWGNAAYRFSNEVGNKKSWTTKEGLATMGVDALEATPLFGAAAKAAPAVGKMLGIVEEVGGTAIKGIGKSYNVNKQLSKIKSEGLKAGKNEFEIAKDQLEKVGITSNQKKGYIPGVSDVLNKYVTPFGYGVPARGGSKIADMLENISGGGWQNHPLRDMSDRAMQMRGDAWNMYLGIPQKHNTFRLADTAPVMHPSYKPGSLKGMDIYSIPEEKVFRASKFREAVPNGDNFIKPLDNPIILDRDANIMGGYNKVLSKDGLQYNDIWDLEPTIEYGRFVPEKIKKVLPDKFFNKTTNIPVNPNHPMAPYTNTTVTRPREIKIPVSKFIGKPFMSHGNLNYTSADYILDAQKHLTDRLKVVAPEGSSSQILKGTPSTNIRITKAIEIEEQLKKLNSGDYPKYKKGGPVCYTCVGRKRRV
jgi:hypothetical protein